MPSASAQNLVKAGSSLFVVTFVTFFEYLKWESFATP